MQKYWERKAQEEERVGEKNDLQKEIATRTKCRIHKRQRENRHRKLTETDRENDTDKQAST